MKLPIKKIMSQMHKLIKDYSLISEGDKIAVGISGGKDSLTLLATLCEYSHHSPIHFSVIGIAVDIFGNTNYSQIEEFCKNLDVPFFVEHTQIKSIVFDVRKEQNPCSLCANLRRGVLNSTAKKLGCNKVALGHHADDLIQTFLMGISQENRLNTLPPSTYLSKTNLFVIRPLLYVFENQIEAVTPHLPVIQSCCPANKNTQREKAKSQLLLFEEQIPSFKKSLFNALTNPERNKLWETKK